MSDRQVEERGGRSLDLGEELRTGDLLDEPSASEALFYSRTRNLILFLFLQPDHTIDEAAPWSSPALGYRPDPSSYPYPIPRGRTDDCRCSTAVLEAGYPPGPAHATNTPSAANRQSRSATDTNSHASWLRLDAMPNQMAHEARSEAWAASPGTQMGIPHDGISHTRGGESAR